MGKPILVVMAAGMGSRYGGLKQIDPVGPAGEIILEYSVFDAVRAGFGKIIFIIKENMRKDFDNICEKMKDRVEIEYAFQRLQDVPVTFRIPDGRKKPWGTGQAVLAAKNLIEAPFAVINADDYYGVEAYALMYEFLRNMDAESNEYAMCAWQLANTLSDYGHVSRGVCSLSDNNYLLDIKETKQIFKCPGGARYSEDGEKTWRTLPSDTPVSMNFWGLPASFLTKLEKSFPEFLFSDTKEDPLRAEFLLPKIIGDCVKEKLIKVKAMPVSDRWYGITYKEDKLEVMKALKNFTCEDRYPANLWS